MDLERQLLVYEVKSSANNNSDSLFSPSREFFYWNEDKFRNLEIGDYVIVVNKYSNFVLFTQLDKKGIKVNKDNQTNETLFEDKNITYRVSGKWEQFIRLKIQQKIEIENDWKWKSLGSSETTYLLGDRINLESNKNRLENIDQLKSLSINSDFESLLNKSKQVFEESRFSNVLHGFIKQSQTGNLKTAHYPNTYQNLKVKVSFGQGASARIPWISFLGNNQSTSEGVYPVYLYFKSEGKLILAYGISENNKPAINWDSSGKETIAQYFRKTGSKPERYGDSFVYKAFDVNALPSDNQIDSDLDVLINQYKKLLKSNNQEFTKNKEMDFSISSLINSLQNSGLIFSDKICVRLVSSLLTKPFVILTGLSGSGKTKLAQSFVKWICQDKSQYSVVAVGADWTNREPLLGFPNALTQNEYIEPESRVLELIQNAKENNHLPYFLILDEMNLSHVERYFADFLSVMESNEPIQLHSMKNCSVPNEIDLPENLFIIGTVNIDETTYMFSPKVLDRANTIEFRINEKELSDFMNDNRPIEMNALKSKGANMAVDFLAYSNKKNTKIDKELNKVLIDFFRELKKIGAEFGYRTANEIQVLIEQLGNIDKLLNDNQKLDIAIMQKLLPKLHGSRRKLEPILLTLGKMCLIKDIQEEGFKKQYFSNTVIDYDINPDIKFPLSLEKICRMHQSAIDHGFASYAEA